MARLPARPPPPRACPLLHPLPPPPVQFLDTMVTRDPMQKAAFLRDLPRLCAQFERRILGFKV